MLSVEVLKTQHDHNVRWVCNKFGALTELFTNRKSCIIHLEPIPVSEILEELSQCNWLQNNLNECRSIFPDNFLLYFLAIFKKTSTAFQREELMLDRAKLCFEIALYSLQKIGDTAGPIGRRYF
jgi:hypothetical protein